MNLAELIKEKGKTQMEVATFLGVSQALVSKWGSRQCQPSVAEIKGLSKFLCVSVDKIKHITLSLMTIEVVSS